MPMLEDCCFDKSSPNDQLTAENMKYYNEDQIIDAINTYKPKICMVDEEKLQQQLLAETTGSVDEI
ncbi:hypothetical protein FPOAC1_007653 [Fusarium poae]|uniref:hypothetical protein n=1 Tax=Fusarium poae TaxID=36050 RepID=UPI001CE82832|nr:hypothetical protein FPOAC1_007653 [Fusarium poae]KAG8668274.1 hypothetical protein FPOAC1_007653 [Fusarium poae]